MSQLIRFAPCFETHPLRKNQFFYNLGRLQELLGDTRYHRIWWKPFDKMVQDGVPISMEYLHQLRDMIGVELDDALIASGC